MGKSSAPDGKSMATRMKEVMEFLGEWLDPPRNTDLSPRQRTKKAVWPSPSSGTNDSDSHTAFRKDNSTALAAYSRQGREHAVNAVALMEENPRGADSAGRPDDVD